MLDDPVVLVLGLCGLGFLAAAIVTGRNPARNDAPRDMAVIGIALIVAAFGYGLAMSWLTPIHGAFPIHRV